MVEIIPVSTTLELQAADEKVMFGAALVLKTKRGYNSRSTGRNMSRRRRKQRKHVQGNILLHQRGYAKMST